MNREYSKNKRGIKYHNLKIDMPELCNEWSNKNKLGPECYHKSAKYKVWWQCSKGHEWETSIHARVFMKNNCPYCANKKVCNDNCLATLHPNLILEWDYNKNELDPKQVLPGSKKKVWWKCNCGYEWKAWIQDRVNGTKCTKCNYGYERRDESEIYNEDHTKKKCKICEEFLLLKEYRLRGNNQKGYWENNVCKKCDSQLVKDYRLTDAGIAAEIVRRIKYTSKKRSIPFDLDKEWVLNRLNEINWKCELTGLPMIRQRNSKECRNTGFRWNSISIDKIIPNKGYIKSNVRFVLNQINCFKQDGTDERMYMLAKNLLNYKEKK